MTVRELISQVRDITQDINGDYYSDSELINIYNECKRYISAERKESPTTITLDIDSNTNEYTLEGVLRYISAKDADSNNRILFPDDGSGDDSSLGIIIMSHNKIYVNTPSDTTISFKVIQFPEEENLNDIVRSGDESLYKYYMLSKAYEKDNDMEQFQKSQYFANMFSDTFRNIKKNSRLNYIDRTLETKSYFY